MSMRRARSMDAIPADDAETRVVSMAISSEEPYERWFGVEVLQHTNDAIDMSRIGDGRHPLLLEHDTRKQIGVIESVALGSDKVLRATARFSRSALASEILLDVQDKIRTLVSVGYEIFEVTETKRDEAGSEQTRTLTGEQFKREMRELHGPQFERFGQAAGRAKVEQVPLYTVTRWAPIEASIVPIPADPTVGVDRSAGAERPPVEVTPTPANPKPNAARAAQEIIIVSENIQKDPATLERERTSALVEMSRQYARYLRDSDVSDFVRNGRSVEQLKDLVMERMTSQHADASDVNLDMSKREAQRYSFGRAVVAAMTGDWSQAGLEREASNSLAKLWGRSPEGFFVPMEVMKRDFNVGTGSEAGNLVATDLRDDLYVDVLRNALAMGQLGARILTGLTSNVDLPRKATASTISIATSEIANTTETQPATAKATLSPKRASAFLQVSKQALIQSTMALEPMLRDDLLVGSLVQIENQAINGVGTGGAARGIRNTSGIQTSTAGANGANISWPLMVALETAVANANAMPDAVSGYLINTRTRGSAKTTLKGTAGAIGFIWDGGPTPLNSYRAAVSNNVPNNLTKGTSTGSCSSVLFGADWSWAVLGLFGAPDIVVDPYSLATTGQVQITLNQFFDFALRQPGGFAEMPDALTP